MLLQELRLLCFLVEMIRFQEKQMEVISSELLRIPTNTVQLTEEQKIMLAMSEEDIQAGRTIDQFTLNDRELEWLKRK